MKVQQEMEKFFEDGKHHFGDVPAKTIVDWAKECQFKEQDVKSTQLRKFYDALRGIWDYPGIKMKKDQDRLDEALIARLIFLKPHLANAAKKKKVTSEFKEIMETGLDKIETKRDLQRFYKFFEAIIAYSH